jgi:hypothetical protein
LITSGGPLGGAGALLVVGWLTAAAGGLVAAELDDAGCDEVWADGAEPAGGAADERQPASPSSNPMASAAVRTGDRD